MALGVVVIAGLADVPLPWPSVSSSSLAAAMQAVALGVVVVELAGDGHGVSLYFIVVKCLATELPRKRKSSIGGRRR